MTPPVVAGSYIKARFWPGETIWARVSSVTGSIVNGLIANEPVSADYEEGDAVQCRIVDLLDCLGAPS